MRWEKIREKKSRVNVQDLFFGGVCFVGSVVDVRWREEEAEAAAAVVRSTRKCNDVDDGKLDLVFFILSCHSLERHRYSLFFLTQLSPCFSLFLYYYYYMLKMEQRKELPYTLLYRTIEKNIICSILSTYFSFSLPRKKKLSKLPKHITKWSLFCCVHIIIIMYHITWGSRSSNKIAVLVFFSSHTYTPSFLI